MLFGIITMPGALVAGRQLPVVWARVCAVGSGNSNFDPELGTWNLELGTWNLEL